MNDHSHHAPTEDPGSTPLAEADFSFDRLGFLRHWLVTGPCETPYQGPAQNENILRLAALDPRYIQPPPVAQLHAPGPFGALWHYHYAGANCFIEHSAFFFQPTLIDSWAYAEIMAAEPMPRSVRFWAAGGADLWLNGVHLARVAITRYMQPDFRPLILSLHRGINKLHVRLQAFGVRDTRILFGVQFPDTAGLRGHLGGSDAIERSAHWLNSVRTQGRDTLLASAPAPEGVSVSIPSVLATTWPAGTTRFSLGPAQPFDVSVRVAADGQAIERRLEIPANFAHFAQALPIDRGLALLNYTARSADAAATLDGKQQHLPLLARRVLGESSPADPQAFNSIIATIDRREDCADFALATLLRMMVLGLATAEESAEIGRAALAFRYGMDEPGADAMCFWSENHSLLFHGCQIIAGRLYPDAIFLNSQRSGLAQATLGAARCREWLERIERRGLEEFNSSTYIPITLAALLNIVDFSGDPNLASRCSAITDQIYAHLASHAFRGMVISPQGRVYRNVLYPEESGTQALVSYATSEVPLVYPDCSNGPPNWTGGYVIFLASSPKYRPPASIATRIGQPVTQCYRQADVEIVLHKTHDYVLSSLAIPASFAEPNGQPVGLQPGGAGYQQHLWQVTLGPNCHIFVNHPGCSHDGGQARPSYWYGNGVMPRLRQRQGILQAIFNIPDGSIVPTYRPAHDWDWNAFAGGSCHPYEIYPIPFTHAHWPTDAFDHHETRGNWVFGRKDGGCIGLWSSVPLELHHDVLTGRELRAWSCRGAWVVICGSLSEHSSFEAFIESCLARQPHFDATTLSLQMNGEEPLSWSPNDANDTKS